MPLVQFFVLAALLVRMNKAATTTSLAACAEIAALNSVNIQSSIFNSAYQYAKHHYWSAANADLAPTCVVFPTSAEGVSKIVSVISKYDDVQFAVKSGGHNPNVGYSSTSGILIALSSMANTTLSDDHTIAYVGPGSRWSAVTEALEPYNLAVVGGRLGDVGVGGYTLGGGLSFLSAAHGFACDNVVNFEVVLADASIVNANENENPDLFWALRGGGNQFGIVTRFDMKTLPIGQVWGGVRIYTGDKAEALMNATQDFSENFHDLKAGIIVTGEIAIESLLEIFVVFFFYNGTTVPHGVFDKFDAIGAYNDNTKVQSFSDLLEANSDYSVYGLRYLIRGTTLPQLPSPMGGELLNYHYRSWKEYVINAGALSPDFIFSLAFQPIPVAVAESSLATVGSIGNAIALDPAAGAHVWMEYDISWLTALGDDNAHAMARNITATIDAYAKETYRGVKPVGYVDTSSSTDDLHLEAQEYYPIFMNDAMYDQQPAQSYGNGSWERLCAVYGKWDPTGFWKERTGGFKYVGC